MNPFSKLTLQPDDPILKLGVAFRADPRPEKVNLGIGAYRNSKGEGIVLKSVKSAENQILKDETNKDYLPMVGDLGFLKAAEKLIFGEEDLPLASVQTIGGSGALYLTSCLLQRAKTTPLLYVSDPTWSPHYKLFLPRGFQMETYPYIDRTALFETLEKAEKGSLLLLHAVCHNPTGVDLTREEWERLAHLAKERSLFPIIDMAYLGLGVNLDEDANGPRLFLKKGLRFALCTSFSKNLGLYGERLGCLSIVAPDQEERKILLSHLKQIIRSTYGSPSRHGSSIAKYVLTDPTLRQEWEEEIAEMRERIHEMRKALYQELHTAFPNRDFSTLEKGQGLFTLLPLSKEQVEWLIQEKGIYLVSSGRINVAGLTHDNLPYVIQALREVL